MRRFMTPREHHDAWVAAWIARHARDLRAAERLVLFDEAVSALLRRARITLGDLTVSTVLARTLGESIEVFPQLAGLALDPEGVSFRELRGVPRAPIDPDMTEALRHLVVGLLAAFGEMTGEALTPLLHVALARGEPPRPRRTEDLGGAA